MKIGAIVLLTDGVEAVVLENIGYQNRVYCFTGQRKWKNITDADIERVLTKLKDEGTLKLHIAHAEKELKKKEEYEKELIANCEYKEKALKAMQKKIDSYYPREQDIDIVNFCRDKKISISDLQRFLEIDVFLTDKF